MICDAPVTGLPAGVAFPVIRILFPASPARLSPVTSTVWFEVMSTRMYRFSFTSRQPDIWNVSGAAACGWKLSATPECTLATNTSGLAVDAHGAMDRGDQHRVRPIEPDPRQRFRIRRCHAEPARLHLKIGAGLPFAEAFLQPGAMRIDRGLRFRRQLEPCAAVQAHARRRLSRLYGCTVEYSAVARHLHVIHLEAAGGSCHSDGRRGSLQNAEQNGKADCERPLHNAVYYEHLSPPGARGKRIAALLLIFPLAAACYFAARLACADSFYRADSLEAAAQAVRLDPANARYLAWLAELQEHEGLDPTPPLERAANLNPRDSAIRIRLGLAAEQRRDFARAERDLLEAARIDRQFDPRATLAHYYFRRGDAPLFWRWVREAFTVGYGDLTPLFQLAWRMTNNPEVVRAALPPDRAVLGRYLTFLLAEGRLDAAAPIAQEFAAQAAPPDLPLLLLACERLLERKDFARAIAVWNPLCGRLLPYQPLIPERGVSLTNAGFHFEPLLRGFDWRIPANSEISAVREELPPALRITLSGRQPETCEILAQSVPLAADRKYRLRFHYRTTGVPAESGLWWRVLAAQAPLPASPEWTAAALAFESGDATLARLALVYQRPAGSPRAEGSIALRDLDLGFAP